MSSEPSDPTVLAQATLSLLETRIRRIEYLLTGSENAEGKPISQHASLPSSDKNTIATRLQRVQNDLSNLRKLPGPVGDLIRDVESLHNKTPEIFSEIQPTPSSSLSDQTTHIFANAPLYTETASRLSSLQTLQVPSAEQSAHLVDLQPRIDAAVARQDALEIQARELRERSVRCLEWWVRFGVVGMGELWTDWEGRVREADRSVSRLERVRSEREGYI